MKVKVKKCKKSPVPCATEQVQRLTNDEIKFYSEEFNLIEIPKEILDDILSSNIFNNESGFESVLVPLLWLHFWLTSD